MARRSEWSASGSGVNARHPPPSYGGPPPPYDSPYPPSHRYPSESPYGPPPSYGGPSPYSAGRGGSYGHPSSSFQPPHPYESPSSYYEPPPSGPPTRHPPSPPRTWTSGVYSQPSYDSHYGGPPPPGPSTSYPPPPPGPPPRPSAYSNRGRGSRYLAASRTPSGPPPPPPEDSKSVGSSPGRRLPMHRQHLKPASEGTAPWQPPPRKEERTESPSAAAAEDERSETDEQKKDGDPLALLAKVSSDMDSGSKKKKEEAPSSPATPKTTPASMAPPTSPLARRGVNSAPDEPSHRSSPVITPNPSVSQVSWKRPRDDYSTASSRRSAGSGPKPITPMPPHYMATYDERAPPPHQHAPYGPPPPHASYSYYGHGPPPPGGPPPSHHSPYGPPPPGYEPGPPPPHGPYGGPYAYPHVVERHSFDSQESGSLHSQESWRRGPYPGPPPPPHGQYGAPPEGWYPPPTTPYPGREGPPPPGPPYVSPYGPPPHPPVEEKTILRKKFSWKHYPELERFLIANRDDYLEHSSKNYTAEQKQYNNWLTERLLEVADQHSYAFDPEDFNFVAIRDRIRCYYKSYVQTARKRGLELPGGAHLKRSKMSHPSDASESKSDKDESSQGEAKASTEKKESKEDKKDTAVKSAPPESKVSA